MAKKKGGKSKNTSSSNGKAPPAVSTKPQTAAAATNIGVSTTIIHPNSNDVILAVVEFHHMLIGSSHKKEAAALSAASACAVKGWIFMGGPSAAVVEATKEDLLEWLHETKKAGKPGTITYWRLVQQQEQQEGSSVPHSKLKVMGYATGKDTKMDSVTYQQTLSPLHIPWPLPPDCPLLQ